MMEPEYLADAAVDADDDEIIRALLTTCFTGPQDEIFKTQRYFREPYPHRWVIRGGQGGLIAHIGVHEKHVISDGTIHRIAGIAEVCVHPAHRGQGHIRKMLGSIHDWLARREFDFAVLFGDPKVYSSSGYVSVTNLFSVLPGGQRKQLQGMVRNLKQVPWPASEVILPGQTF